MSTDNSLNRGKRQILMVCLALLAVTFYAAMPFLVNAQEGAGRFLGSQAIAQPTTTLNSQATSGTNAAVTVSIAAVVGQRVYLYKVSGRCSANGTSSLTVKDGVGGTTIWTTGATEVGTANFKEDWPTPLVSTKGVGMDATLATCGVGNTGTIIVQASQF